jgi:hypothetical protein
MLVVRGNMAIHKWKGHTIQVQAVAARKMLWLGFGLEVLVDGEISGSSPERFEGLKTTAPFQIQLGETLASGYVKSGKLNSVFWTTYRVIVDGEEIASGSSVARNWYMTYLFLPVAVFMLFELVGAFR